MAQQSKIQAPTPQIPTNEGLSPATAHSPRHKRSVSLARSDISAQSVKTQVEDGSEIAVLDGKVKSRTNTTEVSITLSRWDFFKGMFVPNRMKRKMVATMEVSGADEIGYESIHDSPWIVNVHVLSKTKDKSDHHIPKEAQCTFDTGNLHGNIISHELLINRLEYTEADIRPLKKSEKNEGVSVTGDTLVPLGFIQLTWYYGRSGKVFHNMHFLVCPGSQFDLIIGARSIQKHKILSPPNLMVNPVGTTVPKFSPVDLELQKLENNKQELENQIESYDGKIDEATDEDDETRIAKYQRLKASTEKKFDVASFELELYNAEKNKAEKELIDKINIDLEVAKLELELYNAEKDKEKKDLIPKIKKDLEAAKEKLPKGPPA